MEVAPAYDTNAELTTMAAADVRFPNLSVEVLKLMDPTLQVLFEVLGVMAKTPLGKVASEVSNVKTVEA